MKLNLEQTEQFFKQVYQEYSNHPYLRLGQCMFNELYRMNPELADSILATEYDPFHTEDKTRISNFLKHILSEEGYQYMYERLAIDPI